MIDLLFFLLMAIICYQMKFCKYGFYDSYISIQQSYAIRGIFSVIILFSHIRAYITIPPGGGYNYILDHIGQMMVAPFLFYSGFGIVFNCLRKHNYFSNFLRNRVLKTWFHFVVAVFIYAFFETVLRIYSISFTQMLLSLVAWDSIGNSNWFIFDILLLYICSYLIFKILKAVFINDKTRNKIFLFSLFSVTIIIVTFLMFFKETWWYDTLLCFPVGAVYALFKNSIDTKLNTRNYLNIGILLLGSLSFTYILKNPITFNVRASVFCLFILWFTMKFQLINPILLWLGKYSFFIYIYMRLPMIIMKHFGLNKNVLLFISIAILTTIILAYFIEKIQALLDYIILGID